MRRIWPPYPLPTTDLCSFNPDMIKLPYGGHDYNNIVGVDDAIDIMTGTSADLNQNGIPDEAEAARCRRLWLSPTPRSSARALTACSVSPRPADAAMTARCDS